MIEALLQALTDPDTAYLGFVAVIAGVVRGFAGFGTALIIVPLASRVLAPIDVLVLIVMLDIASAAPLLPRMKRDADLKSLGFLVIGMAVLLPVGLSLVTRIDPEIFRWQASFIALSLVAIMAMGWRHRLVMGPKLLLFVGGCGGFLGGMSGIPGPPIILAYMTGQSDVSRIRANIFLYLLIYDFVLGMLFLGKGLIAMPVAMLSLVVVVPYTLGNLLGARMFNPAYHKQYRWVAYMIITGSALISLPVWG